MLAIHKWANANKLEINAKKSNGIVISTGTVDYSPLIRLNGVSIPLYGKVNNNFKWIDHAEYIHSKIFSGLISLWP